jgi:hypothetical protein
MISYACLEFFQSVIDIQVSEHKPVDRVYGTCVAKGYKV